MTTVSCVIPVQCAAQDVWSVLADFGQFLDWATGGLGTVELQGQGVGMIRHLDIPGLGKISERLDALDPEALALTYSLTAAGAGGMASYQARVQVEAITNGSCSLNWKGEFEVLPEINEATVSAELEAAYQSMSSGLESYVRAQ
ncbi:SRPBCC family protein [Halieaceae bacterium IMCC14734]|uniref:SRPBCC family protein n=1 Tax=Candidatus Litorirhabdus singularis TaxID=2518993 RepID=A0ABT3TIN5_9GAMM|nr:SRPBCC family protein [Candidatus Litorirhabdus singularis]MCX2982196.1 SRPBCC family protein [Candidatus Litorirhabdus singularis]